jgi:hypothetical protein
MLKSINAKNYRHKKGLQLKPFFYHEKLLSRITQIELNFAQDGSDGSNSDGHWLL